MLSLLPVSNNQMLHYQITLLSQWHKYILSINKFTSSPIVHLLSGVWTLDPNPNLQANSKWSYVTNVEYYWNNLFLCVWLAFCSATSSHHVLILSRHHVNCLQQPCSQNAHQCSQRYEPTTKFEGRRLLSWYWPHPAVWCLDNYVNCYALCGENLHVLRTSNGNDVA